MKIKIDDLRKKVFGAFLEEGFSEEYAGMAADYVVWVDMSGITTHGVAKMIGPEPLHKIKPKGEVIVEKETPLSLMLNGNSNPGPVLSAIAVERGIEKALKSGFAIVGVKEVYNSSGALSYFVEKIANNGLVGVFTSRAPSNVAGFGSVDPLFGTNPIAFGFPNNGPPAIFDMTTAAITYAGMVVAKTKDEQLPEGIAIDADGRPTTDPETAMKGAVFPFVNSYKGAGLSMMIEMFTGPLIGGAWIDNDTHTETWGSTVLLIDPELLAGQEDVKKNVADMIQKMKSARKQEGVDEVRLPDERRRRTYEAAKHSGLVEINDDVIKELGWI